MLLFSKAKKTSFPALRMMYSSRRNHYNLPSHFPTPGMRTSGKTTLPPTFNAFFIKKAGFLAEIA
jgi:hypothetical protein